MNVVFCRSNPVYVYYVGSDPLREDEKKNVFIIARPLRGGRGERAWPLRKGTFF